MAVSHFMDWTLGGIASLAQRQITFFLEEEKFVLQDKQMKNLVPERLASLTTLPCSLDFNAMPQCHYFRRFTLRKLLERRPFSSGTPYSFDCTGLRRKDTVIHLILQHLVSFGNDSDERVVI